MKSTTPITSGGHRPFGVLKAPIGWVTERLEARINFVCYAVYQASGARLIGSCERIPDTFVQLFPIRRARRIVGVYRIRNQSGTCSAQFGRGGSPWPSQEFCAPRCHTHTTDGRRELYARETRKVRSLLQSFDMKRVSILEWYQILRVHHQWTIFRAIRSAQWLAREVAVAAGTGAKK
jgi:hypothetical protein